MQMLFNICTKESNAVPVGKIRTSHPSLIKSLPQASLKLRDEDAQGISELVRI